MKLKNCYLIFIILSIKIYAITCQRSASTWSASLSVLAKISGLDPSTSSGYASAKVSSTLARETICPISPACVAVGSQYHGIGGYCGILISDPHASKSFYPAGSYTYASASVICGRKSVSVRALLAGYCEV